MVGFISEPTIEEDNNDQPSKLKNLKETIEPLDTKTNDFSFADSFLDFDSLKDWFEDNPNPDKFSLSVVMGDDDICGKTHVEEPISHGSGPIVGGVEPIVDGVEPIVGGNGSVVKVKVEGCEKEGNLGCCIEQKMETVSLVGGSERSGVKSEIVSEEESESSEESESESGSSSSSSSSSSSDDDDDGKGEVEEKEEVKVEAKREVDEVGEIEEGEITGDGGEEMVGWSDHDDSGGGEEEEEDVEDMVGGSDVEFEDVEDEDGGGCGGGGGGSSGRPIRSKNELQVNECGFNGSLC